MSFRAEDGSEIAETEIRWESYFTETNPAYRRWVSESGKDVARLYESG